jgi:hypothetical protein
MRLFLLITGSRRIRSSCMWRAPGRRTRFVLQKLSGSVFGSGLEVPAMFRLPAYDPIFIGWLGVGVLAVTALALYALARPPATRTSRCSCFSHRTSGVRRTFVRDWRTIATIRAWPSGSGLWPPIYWLKPKI